MRTLALLCLALLATTVRAEDKILIRPHWEAGKAYTMETNMQMSMDMSKAMPQLGEQAKQKTDMTQTMTMTAKAGADGGYEVTVKTAGLKASMNAMGQSMTFDSSDPAKSSPMLQQTFGALLGKEFTIVYDKEDMIKDVKGLEGLGATPVGGMKGPDAKQLADAFRRAQELGMPKDKVGPGDKWTFDQSFAMDPMPAMRMEGSSTFDSIVDVDGQKHAKLIFQGKFSMPADAKSTIPVSVGDGSVASGEIYYNPATRMVTKMEMNMLLKMSVQGQEMPMTQKITTKTSPAK